MSYKNIYAYVKNPPAFLCLKLSNQHGRIVPDSVKMIRYTIYKGPWIVLACLLFLASCQKEGDIIERKKDGWRPAQLTTVLSDNPYAGSKDSIFWFRDAMGRVDSAYRYDSVNGRRYKAFSIDRTIPHMIIMDDGETREQSATILFDMMGFPYKVEFYDRTSSRRKDHSYIFMYGSNKELQYYMDTVYLSMNMEVYGNMFGNWTYPRDSFDKISVKGGNIMTEHYISNTLRGQDISSYGFVPFVSTIISSTLANNTSAAVHRDLFDAYIWGEVLRPWLPKHIIMSFDIEQLFPIKVKKTHTYTAQVGQKQIIYSDGTKTISNYYP